MLFKGRQGFSVSYSALKINIRKTKMISREDRPLAEIVIEDESIEKVGNFRYFGNFINRANDPQQEVTSQIEQAKQSFNKIGKMLCDCILSFEL